MAGPPLGKWPEFDCLGYCRNAQGNGRLVQVHNGTFNPDFGTSFNIFEAEQHVGIWGGKIKLSLHTNHEIYMSEKDLEQDLIQGWSVEQQGTPPQIQRFGRRSGAHPHDFTAWHIDTPDWVYQPHLGVFMHYCSTRPGNYREKLPTAVAGTYNTISVTVKATPPAPGEPWDYANQIGGQENIQGWTAKNIWLISWPEESWEDPWYTDFPNNRVSNGGHSETAGVWMPYVHPVHGWPGFMRLFGRSETVPNPPSPSGRWAWVLWYRDSPDGITQWTDKTVYGDPRFQFTDTGAPHPDRGLAGGSPSNPTWIQEVSRLRTGYRGAYQASHILDERAGGVHCVLMTKVHNRLEQTIGGGDCAHAYSHDVLNPTWDTWEVNPNTPLVPGQFPGDMGTRGFNRCPTIVIDENHPKVAGGEGGRYILMAGGGPGPDENRPRYTYVYVGDRPALPPAFPEQPLGRVRCENYSDKARDTTWTCRIPCPDVQMWQQPNAPGGTWDITVKAENTTTPDQRCKARVVGPLYPSGNPRTVEVTFRHTIAAGVSNPDYPDYPFFMANTITLTSGVGNSVPYVQHPEVNFGATTVEVNVPSGSGNFWLQFDMANAQEIEIDEGNTVGNEVMKRYRVFSRHIPVGNEPSFCAELLFDVPTNSRQIRCWLEVINSHVTPHDQFKWERTSYALPMDLEVRVSGPRCEVYHRTVTLGEDPTVTPGVTRWKLIDRNQSSGFGDGYCVRSQFVLLYETGTPSQAELDSIEGDADWIPECNSMEWRNGGYGPFAEFTGLPNNWLVNDEQSALQQAAKQSANDWRRYDGRRFPFFFALHGTWPASPTAGATDEWAAFRGFHHAASGCADFRALRVSVMNEGIRYYHFRYENGDLFDPRQHTGRSGNWSDCFWWHGRQFFGNSPYPAQQTPTLSDNMGKREGPPLSWGQPSTVDARNGFPSQKGFGYDNEHHGGLWSAALAQMTGDPHAVSECIQNSRSVMCQMWPYWVDYAEGTAASQITGLHESRADGRMGLVAMAMYMVTGEDLIKANLEQRVNNVVYLDNPDWDTRGSRLGWLGAGLPRSKVRIVRTDAVDARMTPWPSANLWQQTFLMLHFWSMWKVLGNTQAKELATEMAFAITNYGSRRGQSSNGNWQLGVSACYSPYDNNNEKPSPTNPNGRAGWGVPVLTPDREDGVTNPLYLFPGGTWESGPYHNFMFWYGSGLETWSRPAYVVGYEMAVEEGNQAWAQMCAEQFNDITGGETAGPYGFGTTYGDNPYEWLGFIPNAWKERTSTESYVGFGGGSTGAAVGSGAGTVERPVGPSITGSGGGETFAAFGSGSGLVSGVPVSGSGGAAAETAFGRGLGTVVDPVPAPAITGSGGATAGVAVGSGRAYKSPGGGTPTIWVPR